MPAPPFQGGSTGSNPVGATKQKRRSAATIAAPTRLPLKAYGARVGREPLRKQVVQALWSLVF